MGTIKLDVRFNEYVDLESRLHSLNPEIQIGDLVEIFLNDLAKGEPSLEPYLEKVNQAGAGNSIDRYFTQGKDPESLIRWEINVSGSIQDETAEERYQDYLKYCRENFRTPENRLKFFHRLYESTYKGKR